MTRLMAQVQTEVFHSAVFYFEGCKHLFLSGVRDYIHVVDLSKGHIAALKKLKENCGCKVLERTFSNHLFKTLIS